MEPGFQLGQGNVRDMPIIEDRKGEAKFGAELLECQLRTLRLRQHVIGRFPHRRQVVHQRSGPIENDIPNHLANVMPGLLRATSSHSPRPARPAWLQSRSQPQTVMISFSLAATCWS